MLLDILASVEDDLSNFESWIDFAVASAVMDYYKYGSDQNYGELYFNWNAGISLGVSLLYDFFWMSRRYLCCVMVDRHHHLIF